MTALQASSGSRRRLGFELLSSEVSGALPSKHPSGLLPLPLPLVSLFLSALLRDPDLAI